MILTEEQVEGLKHDINFQFSCVLDIAGKKRITVKDLFDTLLFYMKQADTHV